MKKSKKFTDEGTGKGTIKRPVNPADSFKKSKGKVKAQVIAHKAKSKSQEKRETYMKRVSPSKKKGSR